MVVRKVQLEYCYESKLFAPSDDILTLQRNTFSAIPPNFNAAFSFFLQTFCVFLFLSALFWVKSFARKILIATFAATSIVHNGLEGQILLEKGRLRTLSSMHESRKFSLRRKRNRNVHIGCIVPCSNHISILNSIYNITRRGLSSCLSWDKAMREPVRGISE